MAIVRDWLLDWSAQARVVLVHGPAGSGKTVLVEQIATRRAQPVLRLRGARVGIGDVDTFGAAARGGATVLIDDAQLVGDDVARALAGEFDRLIDPPVLLIAGRRLGAFAILGQRGDARTIGSQQLMFTRDEIEALLGEPRRDTVRDDLFASSGGWPVLAGRAAARIAEDPSSVPSGPNGVTAMARDLLDELLDPASRSSLVAGIPLLDDAVAVAVTGSSDLFDAIPLSRLGRWSVVPPMIERALQPATLPGDVVRTVAARYLEFGEIEAAASLLCRQGRPADAAELLSPVHWSLFAELDLWLMRELTELVDSESVDADAAVARVLLAISRAAEYADRDLWGSCVQRATARAAAAGDAALARAVAADGARYTLRAGGIEAGGAAAGAVLAGTPATEPTTRGRALVVLAMADAFAATTASFASAARRYREAASLFRRTAEWAWRADALARLGYHALYLAGYPNDGREAMEEALALLPIADRVRALWLTHYADVLDFVGRDVEADAVLREAIEIGERLHDDAVVGMAWWSRSWLASHRRDASAFRAAVREVERHRGEWLQDGQELEFLASSAERFVLVGDTAGYREMIDRARAVATRIGRIEPIDLASTLFEVTEGDAARGRDELQRMEGTAAVVEIYKPRRLLQLAAAHARLGDVDAARAAAGAASAAAAALGVPDLHSRQNGRLLEIVAPLLDIDVTVEATLSMRMLGGFSVNGADGSVRTPQPGHPSTLVKMLALNGVTTADTAIDWLWPDADAATGRSRLRNVLNRLKERSGRLVVRDGDTLRLAPDVVVDVAEFERAAAESATAAAEERIGRARRAVALYTGDLLPGDVYEDWSSGHRERLRRRFVGLADVVAADAADRGDTEEAARLLDLAVEIEPLDEVRTLRLCEMLHDSGRAMSAAAVARRCIGLLAELGLDPGTDLARFAAVSA